eukprot:m.273615 g.273615  ORF g.273615 m.273615 type:complete len:123 (+) comp16282_c0_seq3:66-434(+)
MEEFQFSANAEQQIRRNFTKIWYWALGSHAVIFFLFGLVFKKHFNKDIPQYSWAGVLVFPILGMLFPLTVGLVISYLMAFVYHGIVTAVDWITLQVTGSMRMKICPWRGQPYWEYRRHSSNC